MLGRIMKIYSPCDDTSPSRGAPRTGAKQEEKKTNIIELDEREREKKGVDGLSEGRGLIKIDAASPRKVRQSKLVYTRGDI